MPEAKDKGTGTQQDLGGGGGRGGRDRGRREGRRGRTLAAGARQRQAGCTCCVVMFSHRCASSSRAPSAAPCWSAHGVRSPSRGEGRGLGQHLEAVLHLLHLLPLTENGRHGLLQPLAPLQGEGGVGKENKPYQSSTQE